METIRTQGKFHAAHRQLNYEGKCAFVHGHTWRGTFVLRAERFPRDGMKDMSVDFGDLKRVFKDLDHKMLVSEEDTVFLESELFDPEGLVLIPGKNPSVENVTAYCLEKGAEVLRELFPGRNVEYEIEVTIQETDNNFFTLARKITI